MTQKREGGLNFRIQMDEKGVQAWKRKTNLAVPKVGKHSSLDVDWYPKGKERVNLVS